ncbi:DUF4139 domain-containing protein [Thiocystis violacea]|uniref:DUF4139 domain-containing protein n=1 Tax=Thiocystis violacea TaxID=13725 RepID=UPI001F5B9FE5|nr:DUF4139 domain-containing protein [Thiocystis violacea]
MADEQRIEDSAQAALAVTIYNDDLALIKDQRLVKLGPGENRLAWRNVSVEIRPETALLNAQTGGMDLTLLEQNFDFDLLTPTSLLKKYLGRRVDVIRANDAGERTTESATVLAVNDGVVLRYDDRIETQLVGHLSFPDVPEDLRDQPTLVLHIDARQGGEGKLELSYLTGGLSWKADYVADLAPDGRTMDLNGWITLTNASGIGYKGAQVQLVAGTLNRVRPAMPPPAMERMVAMAAAAPMPQEESLSEYHLYSLPRPTDVLNQQTKQVALLSAPQVGITKELVVQGQPYSYRASSGDGWTPLPVASMLRFVNQGGSLGVPLPQGVVRVYSKDSRGNAQFIGEDAIDHTPKNETLKLKLGESFDVTARRKQTTFKKLAGSSAYDYAYEASFAMELKNAKAEPVSIIVRESIPGDWEISNESQPHTKEASNLAAWTVAVPAEGKTQLTWTARVRH